MGRGLPGPEGEVVILVEDDAGDDDDDVPDIDPFDAVVRSVESSHHLKIIMWRTQSISTSYGQSGRQETVRRSGNRMTSQDAS